MLACCLCLRILANLSAYKIHLRPNPVLRRAVIGEFTVIHRKCRSHDHLERIGKQRIKAILRNSLIGLLLIKKKQSVAIEVANVLVQLARLGKSSVGEQHRGEFVIRIGIIECVLTDSVLQKEPLQSRSGKGFRRLLLCGIGFDSAKITSGMIFGTARPVFQADPVFDGNDDPASRLHV